MNRGRRYPPEGRVLAILTCGRIRERYLPHPCDELKQNLAAVPGHTRPSHPVFALAVCLSSVDERGRLCRGAHQPVPPPRELTALPANLKGADDE